ncbi:hypothetical protein SLEP1_g15273 [Rubroshorea leprosula]|uniref:Late embryogenesis abundant protein LEA-2 subgroup domain-containing protein n=1 Tax=Rubroshorea leprosula TaxID=152421 RepID=A0AAV5IST3_9ROSI|nr:hypothetical protein SLEP1_g15273 [Rubroshorea leprosula]
MKQPDDGLSRKKLVAWILIGFVLSIVITVILAVALLKVKEPSIQVNLTLNVQLLVQNQNKANFVNGEGKSLLVYKGKPIGKDIINPGLIPSKGSTTLATRMTLQADKMGTDIIDLAEEVLAGEVNLDTLTSIPGKVDTFLKFIKKRTVALPNAGLPLAFQPHRSSPRHARRSWL